MAKSIKFKNNTYLDSISVVHKKENLKDILERPLLQYEGTFNNTSTAKVNVNIPSDGIYFVSMSYYANQGGYQDNFIEPHCGNLWYSRDIRSTWFVGASISNILKLGKGNQQIGYFAFNKNCSGKWNATLFRLD